MRIRRGIRRVRGRTRRSPKRKKKRLRIRRNPIRDRRPSEY